MNSDAPKNQAPKIDPNIESRRKFLAACGRLSLATPPAIALLLSSAEHNYAQAGSGGGGGGGGRGHRRRGFRF